MTKPIPAALALVLLTTPAAAASNEAFDDRQHYAAVSPEESTNLRDNGARNMISGGIFLIGLLALGTFVLLGTKK